ncbi:MAG: hypothetical protein AAB427_00465, partial [Chloroflexota bacterium]
MFRWKWFLLIAAVIGIGAIVALKFDSIRWRIEQVRGWALDVSNPTTDALPTPSRVQPTPTGGVVGDAPTVALISDSAADTATPTASASRVQPAPTATPVPLIDPPEAITLTAPKWVKQDINNCGPATLAMYLS